MGTCSMRRRLARVEVQHPDLVDFSAVPCVLHPGRSRSGEASMTSEVASCVMGATRTSPGALNSLVVRTRAGRVRAVRIPARDREAPRAISPRSRAFLTALAAFRLHASRSPPCPPVALRKVALGNHLGQRVYAVSGSGRCDGRTWSVHRQGMTRGRNPGCGARSAGGSTLGYCFPFSSTPLP